MSWLSSLLKGARVLDIIAKIKEDAPQAIPLLQALESNDYEAAADVVLAYGDVQELQGLVAVEVEQMIAKVLTTIPDQVPVSIKTMIEAGLREQLDAEAQQRITRLVLVAGLEQADRIIPEESLLKALALAGIA